ncbi:hypothetical protein [Maribacter sp.]|uniref:hypothetical protein n=1 Tax=Maribacter sp. TaxID=1897614 RepID=UPI0025C128DF|nr:hypothetical protein [Maribacter sp.]
MKVRLRLILFLDWKNIIDYYNTYDEKKLDNILIDFIDNEEVYFKLVNDSLNSLSIEEDVKKELALAVIYCDELSLESHSKVRSLYHSSWIGLELNKLSFDKIESMVNEEFIRSSSDYFDKLKEDFPDLQISLIENNIDSYLNTAEEYNIEVVDYILLMESKHISDYQKAKLLDELDEEIIVDNDKLAGLACNILANVSSAKKSFSFLMGLFGKSKSNADRIRLFNSSSYDISTEQAKELVKKLTYPYSRFLEPKKRTRIEANDLHSNFIDNLQRLNLISSHNLKEGKIVVISKY